MKLTILSLFILMCSTAFSQQHATPHTECQLVIDDILRKQSFDIDEPISKEAGYVFKEMYEELNLIYKSDPKDLKREEFILEFKETLQKAADLNLNISMFQEDIDNVSKMTH